MTFSVKTEKNNIYKKALKYGGWIILILSPVLLLLIQSVFSGRNLFLSVPQWSDELDYWREMYSFSNNGFGFGGSLYVGMDAKIGPMGAHSFSPIAAWGVFIPLFRSTYAPYAIVWANLIILVSAWVVFVCLLKPDFWVSIFANIIAYLYPITVLYLHTSMIEIVCMAGMIVFFSLLCRWDREEKPVWFVLLMLVGIWCVCVRITYVVILFPVIWKKNKFKFNLPTALSMIVYVAVFGAFYKIYGLFCAGYPGWTTEKISAAAGIVGKLKVIFYNTKGNISRLLSPFSADRTQVGMRYFYLILLIILLVLVFDKKINHSSTDEVHVDYMNLSLFIMMSGLLVMMVFLYDIKDWRDFRTFAPIAFGVLIYEFAVEGRKNVRICFGTAFLFAFLMYVSSGVDFIADRSDNEIKDLSSYFETIETTDEAGRPRTIGIDKELNWCDISAMSSIPSELGVQVFYDEITADNIEKVDYILVSENVYELYPELYGKYENISTVPQYGRIIKTFE